jgi:hypothetical protein
VALDMGVYGYCFAHVASGVPKEVRVLVSRSARGVDEQRVVAVAGADRRHATVTASFDVTNTVDASIVGTEGSAAFHAPFMFPAPFVVRTGHGEHQWKEVSGPQATGRTGLADHSHRSRHPRGSD